MARKASNKSLNERQLQFCREYIVDFNGTQAAIRAGYSKKTAGQQSFDLLKNPQIQDQLQKCLDKRAHKTEITAERVLKELALIGFADQADYVKIGEEGEVSLIPFDQMPEGASRAVSGVKEVRRIMGSGDGDGKEMVMEIRTEYKHHDKVKSLELIGKHLGMFIDKSMDVPYESETFELPKLTPPVTTD